jgi:predicted nucleic acid-binding Zn ribbon protein
MSKPRRANRSGPSGDPVALGDAVAAVGKELGIPEPDELAALTAAWSEIVGAAIASHASVRSVRDGVCTIEVDEAGWATQIRYAEQQVVERAAGCCGPGVVTSLRVVVAGSARATNRRP